MKNILTNILFCGIITFIVGIDFETLDFTKELITIRYSDLGPDSLIIDKKDMKNKTKVWNAIHQILDERGVYEYER